MFLVSDMKIFHIWYTCSLHFNANRPMWLLWMSSGQAPQSRLHCLHSRQDPPMTPSVSHEGDKTPSMSREVDKTPSVSREADKTPPIKPYLSHEADKSPPMTPSVSHEESSSLESRKLFSTKHHTPEEKNAKRKS